MQQIIEPYTALKHQNLQTNALMIIHINPGSSFTYQHVKHRIDVECVKNGQGGHGIDSRNQRSKREALDEVQRVDDICQAQNEDASTHDQSRDRRPHNGKQQDATDIREKVACK